MDIGKNKNKLTFPNGFLWGAATSAYQVEGGVEDADWSKVSPAGRATNHYHLWRQDLKLLNQLSLNAYRFSIEWSRIEPKPGEFSQSAIEHYRSMLEFLKENGIKSMATLHHFTTPLWMSRQGGWADKDIVFYFCRFAKRMFQEYSDLIDFWVTINEPFSVYAPLSYLIGRWPPQKKNPMLFFKVIHNQILAHKKIYKIFHSQDKEGKKARVGIAKNNQYFEPFSCSLADRITARAADYFSNKFPLNQLKDHMDFIGLNYYHHCRIKFPFMTRNENQLTSDMGWEIYPEGIYHVLKELDQYQLPIYITENGLADKDDKLRKDFIKDHLAWTYKAIKEGVDVRGYFHWSLLDNFEWDQGFKPRFGLIEVDYKTLERKARPSAYFYSQIAKTNSLIKDAKLPVCGL